MDTRASLPTFTQASAILSRIDEGTEGGAELEEEEDFPPAYEDDDQNPFMPNVHGEHDMDLDQDFLPHNPVDIDGVMEEEEDFQPHRLDEVGDLGEHGKGEEEKSDGGEDDFLPHDPVAKGRQDREGEVADGDNLRGPKDRENEEDWIDEVNTAPTEEPEERAKRLAGIMDRIVKKLPATVIPDDVDPIDYDFDDYIKFLKANGQDFDNIDGLDVGLRDPMVSTKPEHWKQGAGRHAFAEYAENEKETPWKILKNTTITFNGNTFTNPLTGRLEHGCQAHPDIGEEFDELVLTQAGYDMDLIQEYEDALLEGLPDCVQNYLDRPGDTALSKRHRVMLYVNSSELWNHEALKQPQRTTRVWRRIMNPPDLREATIFNCPDLRFPSMSILMPFRNIKTAQMRGAYGKEVRHTYSSEKNNFVNNWLNKGSALDSKKIKAEKKLSRKTEKFLTRVLPSYAKPKGMHTYCQQPHVLEEIEATLDRLEREAEEEATRSATNHKPFSRWVEANKVKAAIWKKLSKPVQKLWTKRSRDLPPELDRNVELEMALSAIGTVCNEISTAFGIYMMVYTAFDHEKNTYTVSYECGGKAYPDKNFHDAYESVHNLMRAAMKEIAATKGDTDARLVKVNEVWDQTDFVALKVDAPDSQSEDDKAVYLDPLPFDRNTSLKKLPDLMQTWMTKSLEKVLGRPVKGTGKHSFDRICQEQDSKFVNFPVDKEGKTIRLTRFTAMTEADVIIWRDHIIDSFLGMDEGGLEKARPLRFIDAYGDQVQLSMMEMGNTSPKAAEASKKPSTSTAKKSAPKAKGQKGKKSKKSKAEVSEDEEAVSTDGDAAGPTGKTSTGKNKRKKAERANPEDDYVASSDSDLEIPLSTRGRSNRKAGGDALAAITHQAKKVNENPPIFATSFDPDLASLAEGGLVRFGVGTNTQTNQAGRSKSRSSVISFHLQLPEMSSATLPLLWKDPKWDPVQVQKVVQTRRNGLLGAKKVLSDIHKSLPPLFPGVSSYTGHGLQIHHPGLYSCLTQVLISASAISKSGIIFTDEVDLPPFPRVTGEGVANQLACLLLNRVFDDECDIPQANLLRFSMCSTLQIERNEFRMPAPGIRRAMDAVAPWIRQTLDSLKSGTVLASGALPENHLLRLLRALCFLGVNGDDIRSLYVDLLNVSSTHSLHRYCKLVLESLLHDIHRQLGLSMPSIQPLTKACLTLIELWNRYFVARAPAAVEKGEYIFTGAFPGVSLNSTQADALTTALDGLVWWAANPVDFPRLPLASRLHPLHSVLSTIPLEKAWSKWNLWDQFVCVFVTITSAAPFINLGEGSAKDDTSLSKAKQEELVLFVIELQNKIRSFLAGSPQNAQDPDVLQSFIKVPTEMTRRSTAPPVTPRRSPRKRDAKDYVAMHKAVDPTLKKAKGPQGATTTGGKRKAIEPLDGPSKKKPRPKPRARKIVPEE